MSQVKSHTRHVGGKQVRVKGHKRRQLQPGRAGRNGLKALKHAKRKHYTAAVVTAGVATAEIGAWTVMRGTGVVLTSIGLLAIGGAALARRFAK